MWVLIFQNFCFQQSGLDWEDDQRVPLLLMIIVEYFLPPDPCGCVVIEK